MNSEEKNNFDNQCNNETKTSEIIPIQIPNFNKHNKIINKHNIIMNNFKKSYVVNDKFIIDNIYSNDEYITNKIYNFIDNPYQKKLNLINLILNSEIIIPLNNIVDVLKLFNWLTPLNIEYNMGSKDWNYKVIKYGNKKKCLLQNSVAKLDMNKYLRSNYLNLIKKKLSDSKIKYCYFELKSKRFTNIKDIVWTFDYDD